MKCVPPSPRCPMRCVRSPSALAATLTLLMVAAPAPSADAPRQFAGEQFALLVGVGKYLPDELRNLPYAEADVDGLGKTLLAAGYRTENVVFMTQSVAAKDPRFAP